MSPAVALRAEALRGSISKRMLRRFIATKPVFTLSAGTFRISAKALSSAIPARPFPCDKKHILVACFPKSGSTWLSEILSRLPRYVRVHLVPDYGAREQELALEKLINYHELNYVAQHHCRYSHVTAKWLDAFSVRPVILVRDIFDCVVSLKDHLDGGNGDRDVRVAPMAFVPEAYQGWSDEEKYDFIIDMVVPWYFNFFVGWQEFEGGIWISYEQLPDDPAGTIKNISRALDLGVNDREIDEALQRASDQFTRKNVARAGRGHILTQAQRDRIRRFAAYYPAGDFSRIGL